MTRLRAACIFLVLTLSLSAGTANADQPPEKGTFLIATRALTDPNFLQSVILMVKYDDEGSMGLIINRPTEVRASDLLPSMDGLADFTEMIHIGGPVAAYGIILLFSSNSPPDDAEHVIGNVYLSGNHEFLQTIVSNTESVQQVRLVAGHAGWGPGQLENEITRGDWRVMPANETTIFSEEPLRLWQRLLPSERQFVVYR
jgi:putative transcriptional regulator